MQLMLLKNEVFGLIDISRKHGDTNFSESLGEVQFFKDITEHLVVDDSSYGHDHHKLHLFSQPNLQLRF